MEKCHAEREEEDGKRKKNSVWPGKQNATEESFPCKG